MGTGVGRGENRALSAARDAVTSPLLDNISIQGAKGVLINITGGSDLTIDEVTGISTMIQDEVGDEAEIIFGAVHDSSMDGEVRVTLIATVSRKTRRRRKPSSSPCSVRPGVSRRACARWAAGGSNRGSRRPSCGAQTGVNAGSSGRARQRNSPSAGPTG
jgi:cell division GTPase FtsZ